MTIEITSPDVEALINQRLETGAFKSAEDVIFQALKESQAPDERRSNAIGALMDFGSKHHLSLGAMSIRELRDEARP